jgi:integral membrane protein
MHHPNNKLLTGFRYTALFEGISSLLLFFVAMPLKYFANLPAAVKYVGAIHGGLFVAFVIYLFIYTERKSKGFTFLLLGGLAAIIPIGTFIFDSKLLQKEKA